jgi:hypothetical protein
MLLVLMLSVFLFLLTVISGGLWRGIDGFMLCDNQVQYLSRQLSTNIYSGRMSKSMGVPALFILSPVLA